MFFVAETDSLLKFSSNKGLTGTGAGVGDADIAAIDIKGLICLLESDVRF